MDTVIFTAYADNGSTISTVQIDGCVNYETIYSDEPLNQSIVRTLDGESHSYGNSVYITKGILSISAIDYDQTETFINWLRTDLDYRTHYLGIGVGTQEINLGKGLASSIDYSDRCRLLNEDGEGIQKNEPPLISYITLRYEFKR